MLNERQKSAIASFKTAIERSGFVDLYTVYGTDTSRWRQLYFDKLLVPDRLQTLIGFLTQGFPIDSSLAFELFGDYVDDLQSLEILAQKGETFDLGELRLVWHFGALVFCERPGSRTTKYHGEDSFALARHLLNTPPGSRVLDVCCGVGSQSFLAAKLGCNVVSVDIQPDLKALYEINAVLNDVEDCTRFLGSGIASVPHTERFDLIAANPPLLPVPTGLSLSIVADGGRDGLMVATEIAGCASNLLTENGKLILQGISFGGDLAPSIDPVITPLREADFTTQLLLIYREEIKTGGPFLDALASSFSKVGADAKSVKEMYVGLSKALGADFIYSWQLIARPSIAWDITTIPLYMRNSQLWVA